MTYTLALPLAALVLASGAALAGDMPAPLDRALTEAEARPDFRASYTMSFRWKDGPPVVTRYDAQADAWSLVSGDPDALPKEGRKKMAQVQDDESRPGGLLYGDFREALDAVALREEADGVLTYDFIPPQADADDVAEARGKVDAHVAVDEAAGIMSRYSVTALQPMKPMIGIKMDSFEYVQEFERLGEDGPAVLVRARSVQTGRKGFSKVDMAYEATFSDFDPLP